MQCSLQPSADFLVPQAVDENCSIHCDESYPTRRGREAAILGWAFHALRLRAAVEARPGLGGSGSVRPQRLRHQREDDSMGNPRHRRRLAGEVGASRYQHDSRRGTTRVSLRSCHPSREPVQIPNAGFRKPIKWICSGVRIEGCPHDVIA